MEHTLMQQMLGAAERYLASPEYDPGCPLSVAHIVIDQQTLGEFRKHGQCFLLLTKPELRIIPLGSTALGDVELIAPLHGDASLLQRLGELPHVVAIGTCTEAYTSQYACDEMPESIPFPSSDPTSQDALILTIEVPGRFHVLALPIQRTSSSTTLDADDWESRIVTLNLAESQVWGSMIVLPENQQHINRPMPFKITTNPLVEELTQWNNT